MRMPLFGAVAAAVVSLSSAVLAQSRPAAPPPSGTPTMMATDRFLFVIRGDVLYQFDVVRLQLLNTFRFPDGAGDAAPRGRIRAVERVSQAPVVEVVEVVEVEEPPPPPPSAPPADPVGAAVDAALIWLARHQDADGRWDADGFMKHDDAAKGGICDGAGNAVHDVGVTGLAMLAMLADGSTLRSGKHKESLKRAVAWLRTQQQENGLIGVNASHDFIYDHAIATYALSEAYGLSEYKLLKSVVQDAVDYLESHRNPYAVWRYQPRDNDNDTSVTTWAVSALVSARSFGIDVNPNSLKMAATYYDQVTSPDGRVGYTKVGEGSSRMPGDHGKRFPTSNCETLTAAGTFGRLLLGETPETKPILLRSAQVLAAKPPRWEDGHVDSIYWMFGAMACFQLGGEAWERWQPALAAIAEHQRRDGNAAGSWDAVGVWDESDGRVGVTALNALALASLRRLARLVR